MRRYVILFLLALAIRLGVLYELWATDPIPDGSDMLTYYRQALDLSWPPPEPLYYHPLVPLFIRFSLVVGLSPRLLMCFAGASLSPLVYAIGLRLYNPRVALLAGLMTAIYRAGVLYSTSLLDVSITSMILASAFLLSLSKRGMVAGLLLTLGVLGRSLLLVSALSLALWQRGRFASIMLTVLFVGLLPIVFRTGSFVPITTSGPVNLWIGNHPGARGNFDVCPDCPSYTAYTAIRDGAGDWIPRVVFYITHQPLNWLSLTARKALAWLFLPDIYLPNNLSLQATHSRILRLLPGYGLFATLGLTGLIIQRRRWRAFLPLAVWYGPYSAASIVFFVVARFRVPVVPAIILLVAVTLDDVIERISDIS